MSGSVWIFNGSNAVFPSGAFSSRELAHAWIERNRLSGTLTQYPLDVGVYEWAVASGYFKPKDDDKVSPVFIGRFSSACQQHFHYEDGRCETGD